jgi:molybdopterin synthase catalytic subunit
MGCHSEKAEALSETKGQRRISVFYTLGNSPLTFHMHIRIPIIMDMNALINTIKSRPDYHKVGMILCHNGVVRGSSRDGLPVQGVTIKADRETIERIVAEQKKKPGIIEILVEINEGDLEVGEDLLSIVVAGDIREHVIPVLTDTLNLIKAQGTRKTEHK